MKTLELDGKRLPIVFKTNIIKQNVLLMIWVIENFDKFNLNDSISCSVDIQDNKITISGDEDLKEIDIVDIEVLDFSI